SPDRSSSVAIYQSSVAASAVTHKSDASHRSCYSSLCWFYTPDTPSLSGLIRYRLRASFGSFPHGQRADPSFCLPFLRAEDYGLCYRSRAVRNYANLSSGDGVARVIFRFLSAAAHFRPGAPARDQRALLCSEAGLAYGCASPCFTPVPSFLPLFECV